MTKHYYVYTHRRGDNGEVFYVGCATRHHQKRGFKRQHQRAFDYSQRQPEWEIIRQAAGTVTVDIIEEFNDRSSALAMEVALITRHGRADRGAGTLVNQTDGGDGIPGYKDKPRARRLKAITKIGLLNPMHGKTGALHPTSRRVVDRVTGQVYDSVKSAAEERGLNMKTLHNWLSGHRKNPTALELA